MLVWCPLVIHAQEDLPGAIEGADEGDARFQAVTDAVSSDPEMAAEIVGSLARNFPDAAAAIAVSAIEGLPEPSYENVTAIMEAAVESAPDQREAIEANVARAAPEFFDREEEAPEASETEVADAEVQTETEEAGDEPLPERLRREVDLVTSLIASYPENTAAVTRRSLARVAEEEAFWSVTIVETALAAAPDREEEIVRMAIFGAPHYEAEVREAAGWDPVPEETDEELPEQLRRELGLVRSLVETYPENAATTTRRSVVRVSGEDAYWSVAVTMAALELAPELEEEIVREAIVAAPHYEAEIREAVGWEPEDVAVDEEPDVDEPFRIDAVVERTELRDMTYFVRFDMRGTERSLRRRMLESLELRVGPERYFDPYEGRYLERHQAVITGDDIIGLPFKIVPGDTEQVDRLAAVLKEFETRIDDAREFVKRKVAEEETVLLDDHRLTLGTVYLYPSRKEIDAEMRVDFNDDRYLLMIGSSITISPETVAGIRHLVENVARYDREYKEHLEARERQRIEFRDFTRMDPADVEDDDEEVELEVEESL